MEKLSQLVRVLSRRGRYVQTGIRFLTCNEGTIPEVSNHESLASCMKHIFSFLIAVLIEV